ncbi:MAG: PhoU domain-containing protein [Candidatus Woesearchaeota archaeon]
MAQHALQITTAKKGALSLKKEIHIPTPADYMNRLIDIPYLQGYDEIIINFDDAKVMDLIVKTAEKFLGMDVINQTPTSCTLKNIAEAMEKEFENIFRRLFLLVKSMAEDSLKAAQEKNYEKLKNIADLERMCHKYSLFCMRMLNKYGYKNEKEEYYIFYTIYVLEQISDHYSRICTRIAETKEKIEPEILAFFKETVALTDEYYQCFYKRDLKSILSMREHIERMHKKSRMLLESKKNAHLLRYLDYVLEKITHLSHFLV